MGKKIIKPLDNVALSRRAAVLNFVLNVFENISKLKFEFIKHSYLQGAPKYRRVTCDVLTSPATFLAMHW